MVIFSIFHYSQVVLAAVTQNRDALNHMNEALFDDMPFVIQCAAANRVSSRLLLRSLSVHSRLSFFFSFLFEYILDSTYSTVITVNEILHIPNPNLFVQIKFNPCKHFSCNSYLLHAFHSMSLISLRRICDFVKCETTRSGKKPSGISRGLKRGRKNFDNAQLFALFFFSKQLISAMALRRAEFSADAPISLRSSEVLRVPVHTVTYK